MSTGNDASGNTPPSGNLRKQWTRIGRIATWIGRGLRSGAVFVWHSVVSVAAGVWTGLGGLANLTYAVMTVVWQDPVARRVIGTSLPVALAGILVWRLDLARTDVVLIVLGVVMWLLWQAGMSAARQSEDVPAVEWHWGGFGGGVQGVTVRAPAACGVVFLVCLGLAGNIAWQSAVPHQPDKPPTSATTIENTPTTTATKNTPDTTATKNATVKPQSAGGPP